MEVTPEMPGDTTSPSIGRTALIPPSGAARGETAIIVALSIAAMVVSMAQTLIVPILGVIQAALHTSAANVSWANTATLLSAAVFTPLLSRFGDQHGRKRTMMAALVVMTAGSLLAALTHSLFWLIVGRVLQGSATALFPLALAVLRHEIRPQRLAGSMALVSGTLGFGSGLALVMTGLLTQNAGSDYRRVFWVAAALAFMALCAVALLVPTDHDHTGGRTDVLGALTFGGFLVLLLLPISQGSKWGWSSGRTTGCFIAAAVMACVWWFTERRVREPMVDLPTFTHRPVLFTNVAGLLIGFVMFTQFIGLSFLVQMPGSIAGYGFGASVLRASVEYLLPSTLVSLLTAPLGGALVQRYGPQLVLTVSGVLGTAGFVWLSTAHDTTASVIGASLITGAAISFGYAALPALIAAGVPREMTGLANGINSISRSVGSAIGSATITTLLASKSIQGLPPGLPPLPAESQFTIGFVIGAAVWTAVILVALFGLPRTARPRRRGAEERASGTADADRKSRI
ncbi:MFS transporter [Streptomyces sp. NPDC005355]|uniref:MFS transporter n=1 Tax=Streptomyces sp. NPDC005355 TaxID=3157038 RepID=UPI0033AC090A